MSETPNYAVIGLGVFTALMGLSVFAVSIFLGLLILAAGIAIIVYASKHKRRLMVFYALNSTIPIFMNQPTGAYEKFAMRVLNLARQLNSRSPAQRQPQQV